jgi:iron complex outermembrane receptor protein
MSSSSRFAVAIILAALSAFPGASAQTPPGRVNGVVRDSLGNALVDARVTATHGATGLARSTTTIQGGAYTLTGLAAGTYTISVMKLGFRRASRSDVQVSDAANVDFVLDPLPLQSVVVTATLREQELADVPFSIAAPTARQLRDRGAENIESIAANVAGFSVQNLGPGQSQVAIRGASAGQIARDQPGVKEQVGVYLDDSPVSLSLFTPDLDLFDVSRVEVLRGPQGTLFGSGSLSGTVRYITNQPELGVTSTFGEIGGTSVQGGNGGGNIKLGANVPLGRRAAGRIAAYHNQFAGYTDAVRPTLAVDDAVNTGRRSGVRAAVLLQPTEQLSIVPRIVYQSVKFDGWNRTDAYNILANPFTTSRRAVTLGERRHFIQIDEPFTDDFVLGDLAVRYDFGRVNLTSVTSYASRDILVVRDAGALTSSITGGSIGLPENVYTLDAPLEDATTANVLTQEVRVAGTAGSRTRWLVGGFFGTAKRDYGQQVFVSGFEAASQIPTTGLRAPRDVLFFSDLSYDLQQTAVFGEATVTLAPRFDVTAGLRYYDFTEDRDQVFDGIFGNDNTGTSVVSVPGSTRDDGFAPRFIASFRANDKLTLNAQASRGFRLGGINDPLNEPVCSPQDLATFDGRDSWKSETVWNYEVGAKSQWMGGRASLNAAAFYMDIRDLQVPVTAGTCSSRLVFNVPKSISQGLELELAMAPNDFIDFAASATLTEAELRSTLTSTDSAGSVSVISGISDGERLPSVPQVQAAAAVTLRRPLGARAQGFLTGTFNYVGSRFTQIDDHAAGFGTVDLGALPNAIGGPLTQSTFRFDPELPAYSLFNLRAGISRASWGAAIYVNNLTDERALLALDRERGTLARVGYLTNPPRTVGVTLTFYR